MSYASKSPLAGRFLVPAILAGLFCLGPAGWAGQQAASREKDGAAQAQKPLQYEISVTLKLIQAFVADPKGEPASDLEKSDFVLYDNGKVQKITDFEKHFIQTPDEAAPEAMPQPRMPAASLLSRKFVFLFDNDGSDMEGYGKSRRAALDFLDRRVLPGDEIAVFLNSSASGLTLLTYFTTDHRRIRNMFAKKKDAPGRAQDGIAMDSLSEHEQASPELVFERKAAGTVRSAGKAGFRPFAKRDFLGSMIDLAKVLRQVDGQKNIILFSQGFGKIAVSATLEGQLFRDMAKELASANCPVFAIYTVGGMAKMGPPDEDLSWLASMTGGRYFDNADRYEANARSIQKVTGNYYVLGYSIGAAWDGKFHDVKVEVKRKGYRAFGQKGYFNPLPFNKLTRLEKSLQLIDAAVGDGFAAGRSISFPMAALPFSDKKGDNTVLLSMIPVKTMLEDVGRRTEVISLIFDSARNVVGGRRAEIDWSTFSGRTLCQYSAAALAPGRYDARVVVRNLETGKSAVGACAFEVPEETTAALKLYPPLILASAEATQYANFSTDVKDEAGRVFSLTQAFLFSTMKNSPAAAEIEAGRESFRAVLRFDWMMESGRAPGFDVRAWLEVPETGQKVPLEIRVTGTERRDGIVFLYLDFAVPGLKAGSYELHIQADDPLTKARAETISAFRIT